MKHMNIVVVDGKEEDVSTWPLEKRKEFFHRLNHRALTMMGYVLVDEGQEGTEAAEEINETKETTA